MIVLDIFSFFIFQVYFMYREVPHARSEPRNETLQSECLVAVEVQSYSCDKPTLSLPTSSKPKQSPTGNPNPQRPSRPTTTRIETTIVMSSPLSTAESTKQNARAMNQRQMKPEKCPLGKTQRRRLWVNLRKYCDDLFAAGFPDTHRFEPPQHAVAMFAELGLRHPRNPRALRKFYDNFIPRCGHLVENGTSEKKRKWKPKPGCPSSNGSQPPTQRTRYMSSQGIRTITLKCL